MNIADQVPWFPAYKLSTPPTMVAQNIILKQKSDCVTLNPPMAPHCFRVKFKMDLGRLAFYDLTPVHLYFSSHAVCHCTTSSFLNCPLKSQISLSPFLFFPRTRVARSEAGLLFKLKFRINDKFLVCLQYCMGQMYVLKKYPLFI